MKGFLSGFLIMLGAFAYLKVGGVIGAVLFAFGIISIVKLGIPLYTGVAGTDMKFVDKITVLTQNIFGGLIGALIILIGDNSVCESANILALNKMNALWYVSLMKAILCGMIVDISVYLSKKDGNVIPLLIGIPLFILCGFNHSIADIFYIIAGASSETNSFGMILYYLICVIGNYLGCNARRLCTEGILHKN